MCKVCGQALSELSTAAPPTETGTRIHIRERIISQSEKDTNTLIRPIQVFLRGSVEFCVS